MSSSQTLAFDLGPTFGALLIGVVLGAAFLGVTLLQTVFYFRTYPNDTTFLKVLVAVLLILDSLSLALYTHALYTYVVINFGNFAIAEQIVWSLPAEPPFTGLIALLVHLFLSWRIQMLHPKWRILSVLLALASFASYSMVITAVIIEATDLDRGVVTATVLKQVDWCRLAGDISASVIVLIISGSISYLLYHGRGGFLTTNRIISNLTLYIVASGMIVSITRVLDLILGQAYPDAEYFLIPYICSSKAYANALLATLNSRASRRGPNVSYMEPSIDLRAGPLDPSMKLAQSGAALVREEV